MNLAKEAYYSKDEDFNESIFYEALGIVNITIDPHFEINNEEQVNEIIKYSIGKKIIGLPNESGIRVAADKVEFINKCYQFVDKELEKINSNSKISTCVCDVTKLNDIEKTIKEFEETIGKIKLYTTSVVKYLSVPQLNITANPNEGTSISKYVIKIGDREINSSSESVTVNNIQYSYLTEEGIRKTKFIVTVTDARGNVSDEYPVEMDFIEYVQLAFNNTDVKLTRLNGTSNFIKLHITGYIYNGLIGTTQNNPSVSLFGCHLPLHRGGFGVRGFSVLFQQMTMLRFRQKSLFRSGEIDFFGILLGTDQDICRCAEILRLHRFQSICDGISCNAGDILRLSI